MRRCVTAWRLFHKVGFFFFLPFWEPWIVPTVRGSVKLTQANEQEQATLRHPEFLSASLLKRCPSLRPPRPRR